MREIRKSSIDIRNPVAGTIRKAPFDVNEFAARDNYTPKVKEFLDIIEPNMKKIDDKLEGKIDTMKNRVGNVHEHEVSVELPEILAQVLLNLIKTFPKNTAKTLKTIQEHIRGLYKAAEVEIPKEQGYKMLLMRVAVRPAPTLPPILPPARMKGTR